MAAPLPITETATTPKPLRKTRRKIPLGWVICAIAILGGIGWFAWRRMHPPDKVGPLMLGTVVKADFLETVSATGSVEAQTGAQINVGSQVTGRIKRLFGDVGTKVKAGQTVAILDLPDVAAGVPLAQAAYAAADSKLTQSGQSLTLGLTQTYDAITVAREAWNATEHGVKTAEANYKLQSVQTPTDIRKADAARKLAVAALASSQASYEQTVAGANLNIASAQEAVDQAQATLVLNQATYNRQHDLYLQGMVAAMILDQALQLLVVDKSLLRAAQQQLDLTKQKVDADLKTAKDAVIEAQRAVDSAVAALEAANAEVNTTAALFADVQTAIATAKEAKANLKLAVGNLTTNQVNQQNIVQAADAKKGALDQVTISKALLDKTILRSPISGTIISLTAQQGDTVAAGLAAPTLASVTDLSRMEVEAYVDESDISKVNIGQIAIVTVDAFPGKTYEGRVGKVSPGSTIQEGVITYDVSIFITNTDQKLRPDMTANITIQTGKVTNALLVPAVAIQQTLKGSFVKIAKKTNGQTTITLVSVKTGGTDGVNVQILSGLTEGEQIVLAGGNTTTAPAATSSPLTAGGGGGGRGR